MDKVPLDRPSEKDRGLSLFSDHRGGEAGPHRGGVVRARGAETEGGPTRGRKEWKEVRAVSTSTSGTNESRTAEGEGAQGERG